MGAWFDAVFFIFLFLSMISVDCAGSGCRGKVGVARERNRLGLLLRTGTWWASFEANPQRARLVFKSSLVLSGKAAKDNFTTEPRSPSRLLNRIELIYNQDQLFSEVLLLVMQNTALFGWSGDANS